MAKYPPENVKTLPERVQDNFYSGDINEKYVDEIFPLLEESQVQPLKDLVMDVYYKALTPEGFVSAVGEIVQDPEKAKRIAILVLGNDFLPNIHVLDIVYIYHVDT